MQNPPVQTCNRIPLLSDTAKMGLELSANNTWERWTRTAPVSSSLFVYIKYDDAAYRAPYQAYSSRRELLKEEIDMLRDLEQFHAEQKASYDMIYFDGSPSSIVGGHFVYILYVPVHSSRNRHTLSLWSSRFSE